MIETNSVQFIKFEGNNVDEQINNFLKTYYKNLKNTEYYYILERDYYNKITNQYEYKEI